ncbi:hypothetical protein AB0N17_27990 [Streptomyces sp. NPDC051133]|uniref:hypothetical protein n=1 Tax=Streptomyces sp. NPDC051133 TaxID=3155521 RepID=UPI00343B2915
MTAEQGGAQGAGSTGSAGSTGEYGGMDALMAAITGDPLPPEAHGDPAFLAEHRAAEADVTVLREQLARLAETLTGEEREAEADDRPQAAEHRSTDSRSGARARAGRRPASPGPRPPRPGRPSGPRRAGRIALGALAGAGVFALALGFGWVVTHSGGSDDSSAAGAADNDKRADAAGSKASGDGGRPSDPAQELACSRLVVEGTVTGVVPQKASPWSRVTLKVIRSYKPAHGPAEVGFLLDGGAEPAPRTGQHVLVRVGTGQRDASLWAVGDTRVAVARSWITEALPGSRHTACPSGG